MHPTPSSHSEIYNTSILAYLLPNEIIINLEIIGKPEYHYWLTTHRVKRVQIYIQLDINARTILIVIN